MSLFTIPGLPNDLLTSLKKGFRRLRVDVAQTSFFEGREFYTFYEYSIAAGTSRWFKFVLPVEAILHNLVFSQDAGSTRINAYANATDGGGFVTSLPVLRKNAMSTRPQPYYLPQILVTTDGTASGGVTIASKRLVAPNATAQQISAGALLTDERGIAIQTIYIQIANIGAGAATGNMDLWWEERP